MWASGSTTSGFTKDQMDQARPSRQLNLFILEYSWSEDPLMGPSVMVGKFSEGAERSPRVWVLVRRKRGYKKKNKASH